MSAPVILYTVALPVPLKQSVMCTSTVVLVSSPVQMYVCQWPTLKAIVDCRTVSGIGRHVDISLEEKHMDQKCLARYLLPH